MSIFYTFTTFIARFLKTKIKMRVSQRRLQFMTDKSVIGPAGTVTAAAPKSLPRAGWHCVAVPLSTPFVMREAFCVFLKEETTCLVVRCKSGPSVMADVTFTRGFFQAVFESFPKRHIFPIASGKLAEHNTPEQAGFPILKKCQTQSS